MRNIVHVIVSVLMWGLFGYYWYVVSGREIGEATIQALGVLAVVIIVGLILTFWWVAHNKKLARRNRRSTSPATSPETFVADTLGRPITAPDMAVLHAARIVDIHLDIDADNPDDVGRKIYTAATGGCA